MIGYTWEELKKWMDTKLTEKQKNAPIINLNTKVKIRNGETITVLDRTNMLEEK